MPDLVGQNLQDAQDTVQSITDRAILITTSHDATGGGRNQVLDSGWIVCDQNVAAGERITSESLIDFGVVRLSEECP